MPDKRLDKLAELVKPQRVLRATVDFWDIAGLVKGASQGEGLGNKFLGNIRETQAILHVCRCFDDDDVIHVHNSVDPLRDIEIIETELILADMQAMERRVERMGKQLKGDKTLKPMLELSQKLLDHLGEGEPASSFFAANDSDLGRELLQDVRPLTAKTVIYVANVDEEALAEDNGHVKKVRELAATRGAHVVKISAKVEEELVGMDDAEAQEFLDSYGVEESGLAQIIHHGYAALGLVSYFTAGEKEVRAWTIREGWKAPQAAGVIHTDFERGFIRAEVIGYDDYVKYGTESACRNAGVLRVEGKEYVVRDGDVVHFLFNV